MEPPIRETARFPFERGHFRVVSRSMGD